MASVGAMSLIGNGIKVGRMLQKCVLLMLSYTTVLKEG
jgi:hypothetical protein